MPFQSTRLKSLVREIASQHPDGLRHADFVTEVLNAGYVHKGDNKLSVSVQKVIKNLVTEGVLQLNDEESREYRVAAATAVA